MLNKFKTVAMVSFFDSFPYRYYAYHIPFFQFCLKDGDFVIVPVDNSFTVAKIEMILTRKEYLLNNLERELKSIHSVVSLPR